MKRALRVAGLVALIVVASVVVYMLSLGGKEARFGDTFDELYGMKVSSGEAVFIFMDDSTFLVRTENHILLIDPADKIKDADLRRLDIVLITHEHYDHFNADATINIQRKTGAYVVANRGAYSSLKNRVSEDRLIEIKPGESKVINGVKLTAVSSIHLGNTPLTYIISDDGISIFHGSDSGYNPELNKYSRQAGVAIVPTGGASPTASPDSALKMVEALQPKVVITMHGNPDQNKAVKNLLAQKLPDIKVIVPEKLKPFKITVEQ